MPHNIYVPINIYLSTKELFNHKSHYKYAGGGIRGWSEQTKALHITTKVKNI